ncbi:MAG: hypothetical protein J7K85_06130 [Anaerolineaceae bacterium]|nr:hypothetical protein [Anaerolineaceae bacterium]
MEITLEQLMNAVSQYNETIWPFQFVAIALSFLGVYLAFRKSKTSDWIIVGMMIFFYLWNALLFWLPMAKGGFTTGYVFVVIFLFEVAYLLYAGIKERLSFRFKSSVTAIIGVVVIAYGLIIYPIVGLLIGRQYPALIFSPFFPCPLNIWVMGMFLLTEKPLPRCLIVVPFVWGLFGFFMVAIGLYEDIVLVLMNILGAILIWSRDLKMVREEKQGRIVQAAIQRR